MSRARRGRRAVLWLLAFVLLATVLGVASDGTAAAAPPPDTEDTIPPAGDSGPGFFVWDSEAQRNGFGKCLDIVDYVASGHSSFTVGSRGEAPAGISEDLWRRAIDYGFDRLVILAATYFKYRPHCELLLPNNWPDKVPERYYSETYRRCNANLTGGTTEGATLERPDVVPAWYWFTALAIRQCWLLLPRGAFGLGSDTNAWSGWTTAQDPHYPTSSSNPAVSKAYSYCTEYIGWRMGGGSPLGGGLGSKYDKPPDGAVPATTWHAALHFFTDPNMYDDWVGYERTKPNNWIPHCGLLFLESKCDPKKPPAGALMPELCAGSHPISHYDIGYSEYESDAKKTLGISSISRALWGNPTSWFYFFGREILHLSLWSVEWGYSFNIRDLNPLATSVGADYQRQIVDSPVGRRLQDLFWLILIFWAGFMALRGRLGVAGGELLTTFVMLLLAAFLISNRDMYMNATWRLLTESSNTLLNAGLHGKDTGKPSNEPTTDQELVRKVQDQLQKIFVEDTYDNLNWGQPLGDWKDKDNPLKECAKVRDMLLERGDAPYGTDDFPRTQMRNAGDVCKGLADFNAKPSGTRLMGAILMMVSAIVVGVLLTLIALTIVVGKFVALLLFAVAPLAAMVCILPGWGRKLAWSWVSTLTQMVLGVIGMSFLLSLLLMALMALAKLTGGVTLIERFLLMNLIVLIVWAARRSMLASGQRLAGRLSEFMAAPRGSGMNWSSAAIASHGSGVNLLNVDRTALWTVATPTAAVYQSALTRFREQRMSDRGYRNLQRLSYWKRRQNYPIIRRQRGRPAHTLPFRDQTLP